MSWTQRTPSRAALVTRVFMGTPAFTLASQRRIQRTLTSVSTLNLQLTSYTKPWWAKMVNWMWILYCFFFLFKSWPSWYFPSFSTGKVLVHCIMGVSRSATLVIAYLILWQRLTLRDALKHVVQKRAIYPNRNFLSLLLKLDEQLTRKRRLCPILWQPLLLAAPSFD